MTVRICRLFVYAALIAGALWTVRSVVSAAVRPPKLEYQVTTLANGLTVVTEEDHSTPIVHAQLWYHVGSKNERRGRTGFAHLFEHLMFKGSKNVDPEGHTSMIAAVGGQSNAYTTDDVTVFWETVPGQYLPLALWLEADRMATLRIDKDTFANERQVVKEERRMRVDNQPYGRLSEIIFDQAFTVHPYKHATIGSLTDLEAASVDDVRDFYRTYYVPENATIAIVGDSLFAGSMGGGNVSYEHAMRNNLEKILTLPDETIICPGHGPMTTVGEEKQHNPFFAGKL